MAALQSDASLRLEWLTRLLQDGIAFLQARSRRSTQASSRPCPSSDVSPRPTTGWFFDVRAVPQPENLAYSDLGLGLHTDNPYREPVPGFQALHTLLAAPDGGDSLFADGFALAEHLRESAPEAFAILTRTAVPFRYRSQSR